MKTARLAVLGVSILAGGAALYLVGGSGPKEAAPIVQALPPPAPTIETDDILTARRELQIGTLVQPDDLAWQQWPRPAVGPGMLRRADSPNLIDDLKGAITRGSFFQGEPIRREKLVKATGSGFMSAMLPSGMRAVAINIDMQGSTSAGGFILPNDRVDVIRVVRDDDATKGNGTEAFSTETLLSNVRVLAIGQNIQEKNGERVVVGSNATLEVDPKQAETLVLAQRSGQLSLALRSLLDTNRQDQPVVDDQPTGAMTIVRFGVPAQAKK